MYSRLPMKRICINFHHNRCLCEHKFFYCYSRTYSFRNTNNTDTEIRCTVIYTVQRLRISATKKWLGGPSNVFFCLYGVKLKLLRTRSHPYETKEEENAPIGTLENVNTVIKSHDTLTPPQIPCTNTTYKFNDYQLCEQGHQSGIQLPNSAHNTEQCHHPHIQFWTQLPLHIVPRSKRASVSTRTELGHDLSPEWN